MNTAIIILNFNNYNDTINCIESVEKFNSASIRYYVVDNGSSNNSVEILDSYFKMKADNSYLRVKDTGNADNYNFKKYNFIVSDVNDGYANGNNKGLLFATKDETIENILILNNDILFIEDIIPFLIEKLDTIKDVGIVSPLLLKKDGETIDYNCARTNISNWHLITNYLFLDHDFCGYRTRTNNQRYILKKNPELQAAEKVEIELPSGSCMMIKKEVFKAINFFDKNTFLFYEENILFKKLELINKKSLVIPRLRCIHLGGASRASSPSTFIIRSEANSAKYYVDNYSTFNTFQKIIFHIVIKFFLTVLKIKDKLKKK